MLALSVSSRDSNRGIAQGSPGMLPFRGPLPSMASGEQYYILPWATRKLSDSGGILVSISAAEQTYVSNERGTK